MKTFNKILIVLLVLAMIAGCLAACNVGDTDTETPTTEAPTTEAPTDAPEAEDPTTEEPTEAPTDDGTNVEPEFIDYVSQVKFNPESGRAYVELNVDKNSAAGVKVYHFNVIDGDTTHFEVPAEIREHIITDDLKARFLAINTPESTGEIEPWGKKASKYAKQALADATSIIVESDNAGWNLDSTGGRYLVWIWYKTAEMTEYRNLNLEILQQGLAYGSNVSDNCYGEYAAAALAQARALKLHVFSKDKDPDFYYGKSISVTLKELKTHTEYYDGKLVRFDGVVVRTNGATIYMEEYDAETDMYFGIQIFCGYNIAPQVLEMMQVGNRMCMVGKLSYYDNGGYYQLSDPEYDIMDLGSDDGVHVIETGHSGSYREIAPDVILNGTVDIDLIVEDEDGNETSETKTFKYGELAQFSTVKVSGLEVVSTYTTKEGSSKGAISITCEAADGTRIVVRTEILKDANGNIVTEDAFHNKTIDVTGLIDYFDGKYQVKVFSMNDITIH